MGVVRLNIYASVLFHEFSLYFCNLMLSGRFYLLIAFSIFSILLNFKIDHPKHFKLLFGRPLLRKNKLNKKTYLMQSIVKF